MILHNRWFCVESGSADNPSVILIHGFPSQVSFICQQCEREPLE